MTYTPTQLEETMKDLAERYFGDMRLEEGSIAEKYFMSDDDGQKVYCLPDEIRQTLDAGNYHYVIGAVENGNGETNYETHTVTITPEHVDDVPLLLHELIHVFEGYYRCSKTYKNQNGVEVKPSFIPSFMRDALFMSLYWDLKGKIPDLDKRILGYANFLNVEPITIQGGEHDILFFLKSLDLDLRLGYPLETVRGYAEEIQ